MTQNHAVGLRAISPALILALSFAACSGGLAAASSPEGAAREWARARLIGRLDTPEELRLMRLEDSAIMQDALAQDSIILEHGMPEVITSALLSRFRVDSARRSVAPIGDTAAVLVWIQRPSQAEIRDGMERASNSGLLRNRADAIALEAKLAADVALEQVVDTTWLVHQNGRWRVVIGLDNWVRLGKLMQTASGGGEDGAAQSHSLEERTAMADSVREILKLPPAFYHNEMPSEEDLKEIGIGCFNPRDPCRGRARRE